MNPEVEAMATQLGVKSEEVVEMEKRFNGSDISLAAFRRRRRPIQSISYLTVLNHANFGNKQSTHCEVQQSLECLDVKSAYHRSTLVTRKRSATDPC